MKRRDLLKMFGVAPAIILTPGLLMCVKPIPVYTHNPYSLGDTFITDEALLYINENGFKPIIAKGYDGKIRHFSEGN